MDTQFQSSITGAPVARHSSKRRRPSILDRVIAARDTLTGRPLGDIYAWARGQGLTNTRSFARFKSALLESGVCDWDLEKHRNDQTRHLHLRDRVTHRLSLHAVAREASDRFALTTAEGAPIWHGRLFHDAGHAQQRPEVDVAFKALWLAEKIKVASGACAIALDLSLVEGTDACLIEHLDRLRTRARACQILLVIRYVALAEHRALPLLQAYGFRRWNETPLEGFAAPVGEPTA